MNRSDTTRLGESHPRFGSYVRGLTLLCGLMLALPLHAVAAPVVSNVVAGQRADGSGLVDVRYDLSGATASTLVTIQFSLDGGETYTVLPTPESLSGDWGKVTRSGAGKQITWNAAMQLPGAQTDQCVPRINAHDLGQVETIMLPGGVPLEMVAIPPGAFLMGWDVAGMGSSSDARRHLVTIAYGFQMGRFEVTQRQWVAVMGSWPQHLPDPLYGRGDDHPAYFVSWNDIRGADGFLDRLNRHIAGTGQGAGTFRLPSEAEWEYACRAGSRTLFCFGDDLPLLPDECNPDRELASYGWFCGNNGAYGTPTYGCKPVGGKLPNAFGLHDMHGNQIEWCEDIYWGYRDAPTDGSASLNASGLGRVVRGGHWWIVSGACISHKRDYVSNPDHRAPAVGFRLVRTQ